MLRSVSARTTHIAEDVILKSGLNVVLVAARRNIFASMQQSLYLRVGFGTNSVISQLLRLEKRSATML